MSTGTVSCRSSAVREEVLRAGPAEPHGEPHVAEHRRPKAGLAHPLVDDLEEPVRRSLGGARADDAAGPRPACRRDVRRADPRDELAQARCGERGEERVAVHAGQRDGGDSERRHGGNPVRRVDGQAECPHPAQRGADDRHPLEAERVQQRGELGNRVRSQRSTAVVEGVAQAEPGEVEGDQPARSQIRHQRRPRRSAHATTVHQDERRAVARLQDAHGNRRISQTHAPARDLHATRGKQPALGQLERTVA